MSKSKCSICESITENYKYNRKENKVSCYDCLGIKPEQPKVINCAVCGEPIKWKPYDHRLPYNKYNPCWANIDSNIAHKCKYNKIAYIH